MIFKDYYRILELNTPRVSIEQIKANYRELAKKYHPDVNIENKYAEERFKDINEAYRVLSDTTAKRKYDRMWNTHVGSKKKISKQYEESKRSSDSVFSDFFNMFFGDSNLKEEKKTKESKIPVKGENIETEINVSLEEAFYGMEKKISLRAVNGKMKTFTIKVPAGIRNNEKVRLIGQGKEGKNGGKNGDLFIKINIDNNKLFKLNGCDIYTDLCLTPWEAALGTRVGLNFLDEKVSLYIPAGIQSGETIKIENKGYKDGKGSRGDLIAKVKIMVPKNLEGEEKELFKQLAEISKFNPRKK